MTGERSILIAGGGLAGLTLGIALRRRGVPVLIQEAGHYPRNRVCGEFICGRGLSVLRELGLYDQLTASGATEAHTAAFFSVRRAYAVRRLPIPALCLSRETFDALLARQFQALGGALVTHHRFTSRVCPPGMVRATGRRIATGGRHAGWLGLKAHAVGVKLAADLEMHLMPGGYVGLCRVDRDRVNVCGLFAVPRSKPSLAAGWQEKLRGPEGSWLRERLSGAEFLSSSFCGISGLDLRPRRAAELTECSVGDAVTMIAPVTGNGMSMAIESAAHAAGPLTEYSRGRLSWDAARFEIARNCDGQFARRLLWARWLQVLILHPMSQALLLSLGERSEVAWRACFLRTR